MQFPENDAGEDRWTGGLADALRRETIAALRLLERDTAGRQGQALVPIQFRFAPAAGHPLLDVAGGDGEIVISIAAGGVETVARLVSTDAGGARDGR